MWSWDKIRSTATTNTQPIQSRGVSDQSSDRYAGSQSVDQETQQWFDCYVLTLRYHC